MARRSLTSADLLTAHKYRVIERAVELVKYPLAIAACWIPLQPMERIVHDLAGRNTQVNAALSASLAWSVVASGGWALSAARSKGRKTRLGKARTRSNSIEQQLLEAKIEEEDP